MPPEMQRLLFVKSRTASFIELDERLLAERFDVHELHQPGRFSDPRRVLKEVLAADVIVGWWASWHTFGPITLAWLLRKPSLLIVGGFDTAAEPEFGYGFQLGGPREAEPLHDASRTHPDDELRVLPPGGLAQHRDPASPRAGRLPRRSGC
jgi:hypothetical protein